MKVLVMVFLLLAQTAVGEGAETNSTSVITLERTACFGTCPVYKLTIFKDGKVLFEGKEYVRQKGKASGKISKKALKDLIAQFQSINYLDLRSSYVSQGKECPEWWTDSPGAITSLTLEGKTKTINHYHGCRGVSVLDGLTELEDKIDQAVNSKQWIK
jgi:hypothetical protein